MTDASETVVVQLGATSGSGRLFHTDADNCPHAPAEEDRAERDRETMEAWNYRECGYCAEDHGFIHGGDEEDLSQGTSLRARIDDPDDPIQELVSDD